MKRKIKLILTLLMLVMIIPLSSCFFKPENDNDIVLTTKNVEFKNLTPSYDVKDTNVDLYFYENGNVPLMDVSTFYNMLEGLYVTDGRELNTNTLFNRLYIVNKSNSYARVIFDWKYNTVTFKNTLSAYGMHSHGSIDFNAHYDIKTLKSISTLEINYNLGDYGVDILYYNGKVLMPVSFINFMNDDYYNVLYNGNKLYGYYYADSDDVIKSVYTEIYDNASMKGDAPRDIREEVKNEVLFLLNEKYGLKNYARVDDYLDYIGEENWNRYINGTVEERTDFIYELIDITLNDPHSRLVKLPFYRPSGKTYSNAVGERYTNISKTFSTLREARKSAENYDQPIYYKGNTVFVTFDGFDLGTRDEVYDGNSYKADAYKVDTAALVYKALSETKNSHPEVTNVVFDVSANGGGYVAAMYKLLTFICKKPIIGQKISEDAIELYTLVGDTNLDGNYGDETFDFNYYILESEGTFSAANAFSCFAKYSGSVKTIGKRSGGGMCSVTAYVLTDGTMLNLSNRTRMVAGIENEKTYTVIEIEGGAPVDYPLEYADFCNLDKILEIINA